MFAAVKKKKFLFLIPGLALAFLVLSQSRWISLADVLVPVHRLEAFLVKALTSQNRLEKSRLEAQISLLQRQVASLEEEKKAWEGWQDIRGDLIPEIPPGVPAKVIAVDPAPGRWSVTVNKGSRQGLAEGQTVLGQGGLVGRVVRVSERTSQVLLITDPISVVDVLSQQGRSRGSVKGRSDPKNLTGDYFFAGEPLEAGELLVTSGQDGLFPKGIPVGRIGTLEKTEKEGGMFYRISVKPLVRFRSLETVEIIKNDV